MDEHKVSQIDAIETFQKDKKNLIAWGDIQIGEFIMLIDSDTRVPEDCLYLTILELLMAPKVSIVNNIKFIYMYNLCEIHINVSFKDTSFILFVSLKLSTFIYLFYGKKK